MTAPILNIHELEFMPFGHGERYQAQIRAEQSLDYWEGE